MTETRNLMDVDLDAISNRVELAALMEGKTETEITAVAVDLGIDAVLAKVFDQMLVDYDPGSGPLEPTVIRFTIATPAGVRTWTMHASTTDCTFTRDDAAKATVVLQLSIATFLKVISRTSTGMVEMGKGRVKLKGDLMAAAAMDSWFPDAS